LVTVFTVGDAIEGADVVHVTECDVDIVRDFLLSNHRLEKFGGGCIGSVGGRRYEERCRNRNCGSGHSGKY